MSIYNCHTHIFNIKCAPNRFLGFPLARLLSNNQISFWLVRFLRNLIKRGKNDFFEKYANFLAIGRKKSQEQVFEDLISNYNEETRFIVLSMDMDYMGAGKAILNYKSQLYEIINLKKKYKDILFPFIGIDPRRGNADYLKNFLKLHIEKLGFYGIKLYPSLGFFPFDPRLIKVYEYAQKNEIPIIMHCTKGGIYYQGKGYTLDQLKPKNLDGKPAKGLDFSDQQNKRNSKFKNYFTDPDNYIEVLEKFPNLKLCFAHFGGNDEIKRYNKDPNTDNWYGKIKKLLIDNPNVYTDISYSLYDKKVFNSLIDDINNEAIKNRILFGTDFFMVIREKSEKRLVHDFQSKISGMNFNLISYQNPRVFLKSRFFEP